MKEVPKDIRQKLLWRVVVFGFICLMAATIMFSFSSMQATTTLRDRVQDRDSLIDYLHQSSEWDYCQSENNRKFFVIVGDLIQASLSNDADKVADLSEALATARAELRDTESASECGPHPTVPKK